MFKTFSEEEAVQLGFTHDATTYGVPVWLREDGDFIVCLPKVYVLRHLLNIVDPIFTFTASLFLALHGGGGQIPLPYKKKRRLPPSST